MFSFGFQRRGLVLNYLNIKHTNNEWVFNIQKQLIKFSKLTKMELPKGYSYIKATKEHSRTAQDIIFTVLKEYNFLPDLEGADADLVNLETYYGKGWFGLIINELSIPVGAFGLHPLEARTCKIRKMYLLPDARGKGLGKWMLTFMIAKAKELAFNRIELETASRLESAVHLYRELGFKQQRSENTTPACDLVFYKDLNES